MWRIPNFITGLRLGLALVTFFCLAGAALLSDRLTPATQFALMTIAFTERANKASHASVADCKSRRLGILNGKSQSFSDYREGKKPMERTNSQYGIVLTEGTKTVMGL